MLLAGSDDGIYRISGLQEIKEVDATKVLDSGRAMRVRQFDSVEGVFAATKTGLYHSLDGEEWTNLRVPRQKVYAVCASPSGERLYAGTRPAHIYVSRLVSTNGVASEWRELKGFQDLPSRDEWRTPRHKDIAQVRSLCTHPDAQNRLIAGIEVGGVHMSEDNGKTWEERKEGVNDDIHHLDIVSGDEYVASTGFGLYRTEDAGRSWVRLDQNFEQRYFRESFTHEGVLYAGGAHGSSSTWDEETDHALFKCKDGHDLKRVDYPTPDELVIGWCDVNGDVVGSTHRGSLLMKRDGEWERTGRVPVPGSVAGRYLPLLWYES